MLLCIWTEIYAHLTTSPHQFLMTNFTVTRPGTFVYSTIFDMAAYSDQCHLNYRGEGCWKTKSNN